MAFPPRAVAAQSQPFRTHNPNVIARPAPPSNYIGPQASYLNAPDARSSASAMHSSQAFVPSTMSYADPTPPQIHNPFPTPDPSGSFRAVGLSQDGLDPEMEAQIAQWQSAYAGKDSNASSTRAFGSHYPSTGANSAALGFRPDYNTVGVHGNGGANGASLNSSANMNADTGVAEVITGADGKQKTVVRQGGGQTWQDPSLLEWDPAHFRLFVGNLAGEVTDDSLLKAFSRYPSVQKARVVRDKRTTKSKGYGFVSFADGDEYFQAARDMQGKYIGSHPVLLRKSTTEIRPTVPKNNTKKGSKRGKGGSNNGGGMIDGSHGIQKKQSKVKNGLKVLG